MGRQGQESQVPTLAGLVEGPQTKQPLQLMTGHATATGSLMVTASSCAIAAHGADLPCYTSAVLHVFRTSYGYLSCSIFFF